ncbi:hypothetical protein D3C81_1709020 [compost metagenome]
MDIVPLYWPQIVLHLYLTTDKAEQLSESLKLYKLVDLASEAQPLAGRSPALLVADCIQQGHRNLEDEFLAVLGAG